MQFFKTYTWKYETVFLCFYVLKTCAGFYCHESAAVTEQRRTSDSYYYQRYSVVKTVHNITLECQGATLPMPQRVFEHNCEGCPRILKIFLSNLPVVPSAAFSNYPSTTVLHMESNQVEKLLPGAFNSLHSLKEIYLSENSITQLNPGVFNALSELKILDLSKNRLTVLGPSCFSGIINLKSLNLSSNSLKIFDESVLDENIIELGYLDLSFNQIAKIIITNIRNKIDNINLSSNKISDIDFCVIGFKSFNMSRNQLKSLRKQDCSDITSRIIHFDLSYNVISELFADTFGNLPQLKILSLQHNNISSLPVGLFAHLSNLMNVNLSNNQLEQFSHGLFESLNNLQILDISNNKITAVKRYLHSLINMKELYIQKNKLLNLDSEQLIEDSPHLSKISLGYNNFSCDDLIKIIHYFRSRSVTVVYGSVTNSSNIHGISCVDNSNFSLIPKNIYANSEKNISNSVQLNQDEKISNMYNYFNEDFKSSNFYKYLESMKEQKSTKFSDSTFYSFFNNDFENTTFYRYLENLKNVENFTMELSTGIYNYFNEDFKNSGFVKYLENLKQDEKVSIAMNRIFNEGFVKTSSKDYQEHLELSQVLSNFSGHTDERNVRKVNVIELLLVIIMVVLIIIATILITLAYIVFNSLNKKKHINEQVELLNA